MAVTRLPLRDPAAAGVTMRMRTKEEGYRAQVRKPVRTSRRSGVMKFRY